MVADGTSWYVQFDGRVYGPFDGAQMQDFVLEGRVIASSLITTDPHRGFFPANAFPLFTRWGRAEGSEGVQTDPALHNTQPKLNPDRETRQAHAPHGTSQPKRPDFGTSQPRNGQPSVVSPHQRLAQNHPHDHGATHASREVTQASEPRGGAAPQTRNLDPRHDPNAAPRKSSPAQSNSPAVIQSQGADAPLILTNREPSPRTFMVMAEIRSGQDMRFLHALQAHGVAQRIGDTNWLLRADCSVEQLCEVLSRTLSRQDRLFIIDSLYNKTAWFNIGADMDTRIRDLWKDQTPAPQKIG